MGADPPQAAGPFGDRESLEREIASLRAYLLKVASGLAGRGGKGDQASDLVQQAIKSALVDLQNGKCRATEPRQLRAWVRRILLSKYHDSLRAAGRRGSFDPLPDVSDDGTSPSSEAVGRERVELVRLALDRLSPRDRQILIWRQDEDLTFQEIGQRLGVGTQGAWRAFQRAADRFKAAYEDVAGPMTDAGESS